MRVVQTHSSLWCWHSSLCVDWWRDADDRAGSLVSASRLRFRRRWSRSNPDGCGESSLGEACPGDCSLSGQLITTADAPEYFGEVGVRESHDNGKELGLRIEWSNQTKNDTTIVPRTSGIRRRSCSQSTRWSATLPVHGPVRRHHNIWR